jgi:glutaredoxin
MPQTATCIVYCRSWCGDCRRAIRWLDDMGYEYTERDIDEDAEARERCIELAGKVITPTFEIGETRIVDFDPRALRDALGKPGE